MTDITQTPDIYPEGVYQLAVTDPVLGGPEGPDNKAAIALANRTNYQRMRNVTPWRPGLENEYPAHAYVQRAGMTWKSLVPNADIEPGTDPIKWIRWGFTRDELDADLSAYLLISQFDNYVFNKGIRYSTTVCPNDGPAGEGMAIAAPTLALPFNVYKSALGEVWMYLDNAWRVVAGHYRYAITSASVAMAAAVPTVAITSAALPRAGKVQCWGVISGLSNAANGNILEGNVVLRRAAADTTVADSLAVYTSAAPNQYMQARPQAPLDVLAGDVLKLTGTNAIGGSVSPANGNALYYQYI